MGDFLFGSDHVFQTVWMIAIVLFLLRRVHQLGEKLSTVANQELEIKRLQDAMQVRLEHHRAIDNQIERLHKRIDRIEVFSSGGPYR